MLKDDSQDAPVDQDAESVKKKDDPKAGSKENGKLSDEKLLKVAKERYKRAREDQRLQRDNFKEDVLFYLGDTHWPDSIRKEREMAGQQCITVNRCGAFVRSVTNQQRQNKPAIKVRAVDDNSDPKVAEVMSGLIRHIESVSNADVAIDNASFYAVIGGFGFFRARTDYIEGTFDQQEILIDPIRDMLSVTYDCDDISLDGMGWKWCFIEESMEKEAFKAEYPDADIDSWTSDDYSWYTQDKIRVAEYFYIEEEMQTIYLVNGQVMSEDSWEKAGKPEPTDQRKAKMPVVYWAKLGGDSVLERGKMAGRKIPVFPIFGDQVIVDGKMTLSGLIRGIKDAQRMLNYFRSTEANLLALAPLAPFIGAAEAVEGFEDEWQDSNLSATAILKYNHKDERGDPLPAPQRQQFAPPPSGVLQGAANASADMMAITGIYEANLGQKSNETSGRAINARQQQGETATFNFTDNVVRAIRVEAACLISMIPNVYDTERVLRIIGEDGEQATQRVNGPVEEKDEWGRSVEKIYDLTAGRYDYSVTAGPSFASRRAESVEMMTQAMHDNPQIMAVMGDLYFKAMDAPMSEEIAERLKKQAQKQGIIEPDTDEGEEGGATMPPEVQAQMQQMQEQGQMMQQQLQQMQQELESKQAEYQLKQQEIQVKQFDAETKRMAVEASAQPQQAPIAEAPELSEADRLEIEIEREKMKLESDRQHAIDMELLRHRLGRVGQKDDGGNEIEVDENGMAKKSDMACHMEEMHNSMIQSQANIDMLAQQLADLSRIQSAPKVVKTYRDAQGNLVGELVPVV